MTNTKRTTASLQGEIYDNLTLQRERLEMLRKLINTAIADLHKYPDSPKLCNEEAGITLGIAQYLIDEFEYNTQSDIEKMEKEGKA